MSHSGLVPQGIDHIVLRVGDLERAVDFYCRYIGASLEDDEPWWPNERNIVSLRIGDALIHLTQVDEPGAIDNKGVAHICIAVSGTDPEKLRTLLDEEGVLVNGSVINGRRGAKGGGPSLYITDRDGYRIELKWYDSHSQ